MGGKSEMSLGASDEIRLSMKTEIKTGGLIKVFGGVNLTSYLGLLVETALSVKFEFGEVHMKTKSMTVDMKEVTVTGDDVNLSTAAVSATGI